MYEAFRDRADFFVIYIAEAHSDDGWNLQVNEEAGIDINQHTNLEERQVAARRCAAELEMEIPMLVDDMSDATGTAFSAWPERIYILAAGDGNIAYKGGHGPYDFDPDEAREALQKILG